MSNEFFNSMRFQYLSTDLLKEVHESTRDGKKMKSALRKKMIMLFEDTVEYERLVIRYIKSWFSNGFYSP